MERPVSKPEPEPEPPRPWVLVLPRALTRCPLQLLLLAAVFLYILGSVPGVEAYSTAEYDKKITIRLFTRSNPTEGQILKVKNPNLLNISNFNASRPTKMIVHGWLSSQKEGMGGSYLREGLLEKMDCNVILVDWSELDSINYISSRLKVSSIGKFLGQMIAQLQEYGGLQLGDLHLIGHSLGAHIMGFAGRSAGLGNESRITGLDPAGPLFWNDPKIRLDYTDAGFVDVIHTCGYVDGYLDPIGHADFYPNGGTYIQPGCGFDISTCSHCRSYLYMIESMDPAPFIGTQCSSKSKYKKGECADNPTALLGLPCDSSARGKFYLVTNKSSPFSINATVPGNNAIRSKGHLVSSC